MKSDIRHFWELLFAMTEKELRSRYKYTIFGFFWLVANPVLQMIIIYFVFSLFIKEPIPNYQYYLFIGLLVWNFFSLSLTKGTPCIVNERSLIKKAKFPRSVIPLSIIFSNLVHFSLALVLFIIPVLFFGNNNFSKNSCHIFRTNVTFGFYGRICTLYVRAQRPFPRHQLFRSGASYYLVLCNADCLFHIRCSVQIYVVMATQSHDVSRTAHAVWIFRSISSGNRDGSRQCHNNHHCMYTRCSRVSKRRGKLR